MWGSDSVRESILGLEGAPSPFKAERQRRANSSATSLQAVIKTFCLNFNFVCSVLTHTPQTRFCLICNSVTASYNIVYRKNIFSPRARNVGVCVSISMLTNPNWTIQYIHTALLYWDQPLGVTIIQLSTAPWLPLCWVQAWNNIHNHLRRRKEGQDTFWEKKIILLNLFVHKLCNKYISSQRNHFLNASLSFVTYTLRNGWTRVLTQTTVQPVTLCPVKTSCSTHTTDHWSVCASNSEISQSVQTGAWLWKTRAQHQELCILSLRHGQFM